MLKHFKESGQITQVNREYFLLTVKFHTLLNILKKYSHKLFTVSEFGRAAGISRKYSIPLLEHLDTLGVTKREKGERKIDEDKLQNLIEKLGKKEDR